MLHDNSNPYVGGFLYAKNEGALLVEGHHGTKFVDLLL